MEVIKAIFLGIGIGSLMALTIGPVFFTLMQNSLHRGYKATFPITIGVIITDITYAGIGYFGVSKLIENQRFQLFMSIFGGIIMMIFGIYNLIKVKKSRTSSKKVIRPNSFIKQLFTGILINGVNPIILIFWIGLIGTLSVSYAENEQLVPVIIVAILSTVFLTDNVKVFLAHRLSKLVTAKLMRILNMVIGIGFIIFSLKLFHFGYELGNENLF